MIKKKICNLSKLEDKNYFKLWVDEIKDEIIIFKNDEKIHILSFLRYNIDPIFLMLKK